MTKHIVIDCDPGIDDAIGILTAVGSGLFTIDAITSVAGNVPAPVGAKNAQKILGLVGSPDIPVACGAEAPTGGALPLDPFSHGSDGLAETNLRAPQGELDGRSGPEVLVDAANTHPGTLTILETGPMTNLALALDLDPTLPSKVSAVIAIAGAFGLNDYTWQNATGDNPTSEWNVYVDPDAARRVIHAGLNLTLIGIDVAMHPGNSMDVVTHARLAHPTGPATRFFADAVHFITRRGFDSYCALIDPLAVALSAHPEFFKTDSFLIDVETEGRLTRGQTVVERRTHFRWPELASVQLVTNVAYDRVLRFIVESVAACDALGGSTFPPTYERESV